MPSNGTFKTKHNGREQWCAYYSFGSGRSRKFIRAFADTEHEAIIKRERLFQKRLGQAATATPVAASAPTLQPTPKRPELSFKDTWDLWLRIGKSPRTVVAYEVLFTKWLEPNLPADLNLFDKATLQRLFYTELPANAPASVPHNAYNALKAFLNFCVKNEHLEVNPLTAVTAPKKTSTTNTDDQKYISKRTNIAIRLLRHLKKTEHPDYLLWLMSITLGLRRAELIGLTWDCINSIETKNGASVFIKQQLMTVHGKTQIVPKTKSKKPRRIELTEEIRLLLLAEKRRTGGGPTDPIFTREDGSLMNEQEYSRRWKAAFASYTTKESDYFRPHYNRHITASLLHRAGYSMDQTSEMLGHQNSTITRDVYTHLTRGQARSAVVDVEKIING